MNYISAEEFSKQSEKVQKVLLDWWKPQIGDIYMWEYYKGGWNEMRFVKPTSKNILNGTWAKHMAIPLLQMHQLIKFIESRKGMLDIIYSKGERKFINFYDINENEDYPIYKIKGHDLLEALWQVACEIAEGD